MVALIILDWLINGIISQVWGIYQVINLFFLNLFFVDDYNNLCNRGKRKLINILLILMDDNAIKRMFFCVTVPFFKRGVFLAVFGFGVFYLKSIPFVHLFK